MLRSASPCETNGAADLSRRLAACTCRPEVWRVRARGVRELRGWFEFLAKYPHRSYGPGKAYDARGGGGAEPSAERPYRRNL